MVVLILYQYDIKYVTKCNTKFKKCRKYGTLRVDLTGVEPVSKIITNKYIYILDTWSFLFFVRATMESPNTLPLS